MLINNLPAARLTDTTAHGGVIMATGAPTVLIGDPAFVLPPNIRVGGDAVFQSKVIRDLYTISTTRSGAALLTRLGASGQPIRIKPTLWRNVNATVADDTNNAAAAGKPAIGGGVGTGIGSGSTIYFDPDFTPATAANPAINRPSDVGLNHELCHADNNAQGVVDASPDTAHPNNGTIEETRVINADNNYRDARGIPRRADHTVM